MATLTLTLSDQNFIRLQRRAKAAGVSPEAWLRAKADEWLAETNEAFFRSLRRVLDRNAELYRRLA